MVAKRWQATALQKFLPETVVDGAASKATLRRGYLRSRGMMTTLIFRVLVLFVILAPITVVAFPPPRFIRRIGTPRPYRARC